MKVIGGIVHQDYWIPMSQYGVKFNAGEEAEVDDTLEEIQRQILDSDFNEASQSCITLKEHHHSSKKELQVQ